MPFQRRRKYMFHWRGRAWLTIGDRVKIPRYSRRLMHRKRVTWELHDSYFRLMTIKHAITKTAEVTHSDGQLWGDIEWAIELLYNSVKTGSQLVLEIRELESRCGRESQQPAEGALGTPDWAVWRSEFLETRCGRENQHPAESWASGWATLENKKDTTLMAIRVGANMLQFCSVSNTLSHTTLSNKVGGIFFLKDCVARLYPIYPTPPLGQDMTQGQFLSGV